MNLPFEKFVLDTRYTLNLVILTVAVSLVGTIFYIGFSIFLKSDQVWIFLRVVKRILITRKVAPIPAKEQEPISPPTTETGGV